MSWKLQPQPGILQQNKKCTNLYMFFYDLQEILHNGGQVSRQFHRTFPMVSSGHKRSECQRSPPRITPTRRSQQSSKSPWNIYYIYIYDRSAYCITHCPHLFIPWSYLKEWYTFIIHPTCLLQLVDTKNIQVAIGNHPEQVSGTFFVSYKPETKNLGSKVPLKRLQTCALSVPVEAAPAFVLFSTQSHLTFFSQTPRKQTQLD